MTTSGVSNFVVAAEMFYSTDGTDYKNSKLWGYKNVKVIPNGLFNFKINQCGTENTEEIVYFLCIFLESLCNLKL